MEIIPILSTIILVATIATFILAIAAYVLYKVRERRARQGGVVRTDVVMHPDHGYASTQPMLGQPYAPSALPPMQPVGPPLALPAPTQAFAGMQGVQGMQGMASPLAVDTNADGRLDTVYEPRPTFQNPMTGQPAAYQPSPDRPGMAARTMPGMTPGATALPGMPGVQGLPGMVAAQPVAPLPAAGPQAGRGGSSMFYEVTHQGLVPAAEQQEQARLGAIQREQDRLEAAEDASKERLDTLRRQQGDAPAWL
jgi:hypothetical protein